MKNAILITTGGTGGHMFPAIALGTVLADRGHEVTYAVDPRGARYLDGAARRVLVNAQSPSGSLPRRLAASARLGTALALMLARFLWARPKAVAALGGYASVPTGLAAGLLRVPLVLHEQNAVLGRAHRLLARFARSLALTFERTQGVPTGVSTTTVGNPVRGAFRPTPVVPEARLRLLVTGGSQGARIFSDVVPAAVAMLPDAVRDRLAIVQQCRAEDLPRVEAAYAESGVAFEVRTFFDDMPSRLADASLVVCRSGASSVAELLVVGRASILVPFPHAADDHQRANAEALADEGAATVVAADAFTPEWLAAELTRLLDAPELLAAMAHAAAVMARPDAAEKLADQVEEALP